MRIILLIIKSIYYLFLFCAFIFLALYPTDEYWNIISTVFIWLVGILYLIRIFTKKMFSSQLMKHGLIYFVIGVVISTLGIFVAGEILFKLSFLVFIFGAIGSFVEYKKVQMSNNEKS